MAWWRYTRRNLIESTWIQIVFTIFRLIWNQTNFRLVPNQSENGEYNLISGWLNNIFLRVAVPTVGNLWYLYSWYSITVTFKVFQEDPQLSPQTPASRRPSRCTHTQTFFIILSYQSEIRLYLPLYLPNGLPFGSKSIGKWWIQSDFGLI